MKDNDFEWVWKTLETYLMENNLKQSKQRNEIIQVILDSNDHFNAEILLNNCKDSGIKASLATVYRTLNLLCDVKLVIQHSFDDGHSTYELKHPEDHHDHLICTDCGKILEFEDEEIENIQLKIAENLGFKLTSHRLDLYGKCLKTDCPEKKK